MNSGNLSTKKSILIKRLSKANSHYVALTDYKNLITDLVNQKDVYNPLVFQQLPPQEKAIFDAYLKRFSSLQDFLGSKIFPSLFDIAGIGSSKMSEIISIAEKETIIDSLSNWIELRQIRNDLEHDYPEKLKDALDDLKYCINHFNRLESYYNNSITFAKKYINEII